jgi:pimeloyl-ACP methyl ester carboxylesterase
MAFDCAFVKGAGFAAQQKGAVYHMHGNDGIRSKAMFAETMLKLAPLGYTSLSCDQRGYSPGASPDDYSAYNYNELTTDLFAVVNASEISSQFGGKFHIVAHDQGARVSWHAIASRPEARARLLSFTSLSIPHSDVFSDALIGPKQDVPQASSSQYVRMLVLPDAPSHPEILSKVCHGEGWATAEACDRILWWYNGAIDSGAMVRDPASSHSHRVTHIASLASSHSHRVTRIESLACHSRPGTRHLEHNDQYRSLNHMYHCMTTCSSGPALTLCGVTAPFPCCRR